MTGPARFARATPLRPALGRPRRAQPHARPGLPPAMGALRSLGNRSLQRAVQAHRAQVQPRDVGPVIQRQLYPPIPIVVMPPRTPEPVVVNAVDARQEPSLSWYKPWRYTGPITSFFRGDVTMTDISSMVTNVIAFLGSRSMHRLNLMDHGNAAGVEIGDDWLGSAADVTRHASTLGRLRSKFASGALVHLQNCHAGQNRDVMCTLAGAVGVPVYGGTGLQNPLLGFNLGDYVSCDAAGTFNPNAGRPSTPTAPALPRQPEMA